MKPKMVPQVKIFIVLLLLCNLSISGRADNFKAGEVMKGRKLLIALDAMLDYQEPGANPGHEPRNGNGGGRGGGHP